MAAATTPSASPNGRRSPARHGQEPFRALGDLRRSREVTQVQLAHRLAVSQATVSKFERSNPSIATVRRYVEALGGHLVITAVFDDDQVVLDC